MFKKTCISILCVLTGLTVAAAQSDSGAPRMTPEEYIARFRDAAVTDMQKTGVPASITLAQGMYESDYGNSPLAKNANNHFGIKCHKEWTGPTFHQDDDAADECFRKYNNVQESYDDHSYFLRSRDRYKFLFDLDIKDYKGWANGLKKAGYATNPKYASKIIDLIERFHLSDLDDASTAKNYKVKDSEPAHPLESSDTDHVPVPSSNTNATGAKADPKVVPPSISANGTINDLPVVRAKKGDSWLKLSIANHLELWQILKYNDAEKNDFLKEGDLVYLKPKKNNAQQEYHIVKEGETMRSISQLYGVKVSVLYRRNNIDPGSDLHPGDKISLKGGLFVL